MGWTAPRRHRMYVDGRQLQTIPVPENGASAFSGIEIDRNTYSPNGRRVRCHFVSEWIRCAMITLLRSSEFDAWLRKLADQRAKARILARLTSAALGNFGDCEPVGEGVAEMRIHVEPGYPCLLRAQRAGRIPLSTGGDKASQQRDIERAKQMARALRENRP